MSTRTPLRLHYVLGFSLVAPAVPWTFPPSIMSVVLALFLAFLGMGMAQPVLGMVTLRVCEREAGLKKQQVRALSGWCAPSPWGRQL